MKQTKNERTVYTEDSGLGQVTERADENVYNFVTQQQAADLSRGMYQGETKYTSDLINSYAWDTAIVFLQKFDDRTNKETPYSLQASLNTGNLAKQGTNYLEKEKQDKICNIWDMASNTVEYETEIFQPSGAYVSARGGQFNWQFSYAAKRVNSYVDSEGARENYSFRMILYLEK